MTLTTAALLIGLTGIVGIALGYFLRWLVSMGSKSSAELKVKQMILEAQEKAKNIVTRAEEKAEETLHETRQEVKEREEKSKKTEDRLIKKEELLDKRQTDIDREVENIKGKIVEIKSIRERAEKLENEKQVELERVAKLTEDEARQELYKLLESKQQEDLLVRMQKLENAGSEQFDTRAREILAGVIQRLSSSVSSEIMTSSISIPSDEVKGKIIGKEGRNIKAFERETGVEVIVDDTPGTITISSYDPTRRQIARVALENLILDGRIQPAKIEETVQKAKNEINKIIKDKGEQAAYECGVYNLDPRLISILGRLYFRTSYGQNVLQHSKEVAHLSGMLAEELGGNVAVAKAGGLLHDIGKALDHEITGSHVEIGRRILHKFNVDESVVQAMQAHHDEYPHETLESVIVHSADAISGSRPGARRDTVENYLKRLEELEGIAMSFNAVERAYALQAGREIRVFVSPKEVTDLAASDMAREIATQIEKNLKYPGEIKVTLIRENRITEFAR